MENIDLHKPASISIEDFVNQIGIKEGYKQRVVEWWNENKSHIKIYFFPFNTDVMIGGCVLSSDSIAINSKFENNSEKLLYMALHETAHVQQEIEGRLSPYFDTVVQNDIHSFLDAYTSLEIEANNFAHNSMLEMGFDSFIREYGVSIRLNEYAGSMVYPTMQSQIKKHNPTNFIEMVEKMIF